MENTMLDRVKSLYKEEDFELVYKAYRFAENAHKEQRRVSGELYIVHPVMVCDTLIDLGMDASTLVVALLHDIIEDTIYTQADIEKEFGKEIADMVEALTRLNRLNFHSDEEEQAEYMRRLFFAMSKDVRVLLVKLSDRLHNMRTLGAMPIEKQQKKAKETLDLYAPLAGRLGIANMKCELEDLALKYLHPEAYHEISKEINQKIGERMMLAQRVVKEVEEMLKKSGVVGEVKGRPKHFYSIYKKMKEQNKTIDQIYDLIAVRVILENERDCYAVLGDIHGKWKPIQGRFKDYIAVPKPNNYQSLHTTVVTDFGEIFEIQIRTYEMNRIAEYGIAAHWKYKEGISSTKMSDLDTKLGFIKELMDVQGDIKDNLEFVDALKLNVSTNEIYVFSPKGRVFNLPSGSNAIDFAYRLHSEVGNKCVGAKINSKIMPLGTVLKNGDIVEIITNNNSKGPSRDWLKIVKTPTARAKIRSFFKKEMKTENIKNGKDMLTAEAKRKGYALSDLIQPNWVKYLLDRYSFSDIDDLYASVGYGGHTTNQILGRLIEYYRKAKEVEQAENRPIEPNIKADNRPKKFNSGIIVAGYDDFLIRVSHCCNPVPGDKIIGYVSRGRGVTVHRADCPNLKNIEPERILKATWASNMLSDNYFAVAIRILCVDKYGMLGLISQTIAGMKLSITQMTAKVNSKNGTAVINLAVDVKSIDDVDDLIKKLYGIDGVLDATRGT